MRFGVDYYPEQCGRENWEWDAGKMHEMGVEVIRMAEFAWARMEPAQGYYDFAWLDEIICRAAFQRWLQQKYKTVECLNEAWGTVFWSQTYFRFDQIPVPCRLPIRTIPHCCWTGSGFVQTWLSISRSCRSTFCAKNVPISPSSAAQQV